MDGSRVTVRAWLKENGYPEIAEMIEDIQTEWKNTGKRTRRNWWDVLSGEKMVLLVQFMDGNSLFFKPLKFV